MSEQEMNKPQRGRRAQSDDAPNEDAQQERPASYLVKVGKDGQFLHIHPGAVADHKRLGWAVVN